VAAARLVLDPQVGAGQLPEPTDLERDLQILEVEMRKLEGEYNMYFSGRLPRPPWETRTRVQALVKRLDRSAIQNYGDRFRFNTLQAKFSAFVDLWDRGLRAREEGRPGPFVKRAPERQIATKTEDKILFVASFSDPLSEMEKLHNLYDTVRDARERLGENNIPFHKFTELVKGQVAKLKKEGAPEVAFRVAMKDGKLSFTARALKGSK
jgi:hypothetical protein